MSMPDPTPEVYRRLAEVLHIPALDRAAGEVEGVVIDDLYEDVAAALKGDLKPIQPDAGSQRADDLFLLYSGKVNVLMGDPESGKTLIALAMGVDTLRRGGSFAILDLDHNGVVETLSRLLSFGADPEHLADRDRFRLAIPETQSEYMALVHDISEWKPSLVLVDSVGELGALFGANLNRDEDFAPLNRKAIQPFATAGSAVITIDHMAKNQASRQFGAGGTMRKKAVVNGASYEVRLRGAGFTRSAGGEAAMYLKKDRPGGVKDRSPRERDPLVAIFTLTPPLFGNPSSWVFTPGSEVVNRVHERLEEKQADARESVLEALEKGEMNATALNAVLADAGMKNTGAQREFRERLVAQGLISGRPGPGKSTIYSLNTSNGDSDD